MLFSCITSLSRVSTVQGERGTDKKTSCFHVGLYAEKERCSLAVEGTLGVIASTGVAGGVSMSGVTLR